MSRRSVEEAEQSRVEASHEHLLRLLVDNLDTHAIFLLDLEGRVGSWNPGAERIKGYRADEVIGEHFSIFYPPEELEAGRPEQLLREAEAKGRTRVRAMRVRKDGSRFPAEVVVAALRGENGKLLGYAKVVQDLTERDEASRAQQRLQLHFEQTPLGIIEWDLDFRVVAWNPAAERIFGYSADEAMGQHASFIVPEHARPLVDGIWRDLLRRQGGERSTNDNVTRDGRLIHCEWYNTPLVGPDGAVVGVASQVEDETDRRAAEEQSRRKIDQMAALRSIDLAITASHDLRVTLTVLLDQVTTQLDVDAANILLLNPHTRILGYAGGRGFCTEGIQNSEIRLGECSAGRAALERRTVAVPRLAVESNGFTRDDLLHGDEFVSHYAVPLVAKGEVKGVLEVFHREPLSPAADWLDFLEALAGQAAIAVESARLFEDLQRSNLELVLAYDSTLEGWSQALDMRDSVTEGHSRRVTEMTVRLARTLGMSDAQLVHVRRGALLHDIGKLGIPDAILRKEGPLSEEEWEIMRQHPVYAFRLLSQIEFLRAALDIPYAHHERWDGAGYPRGLEGEQIPLAARIFAVVDVWDAIRSERPYHQPMSEDEARDHIRASAGSHLDPLVAETFLSMEW
jgi:PAS domain S-box-containing protein/putative nucleotidyltransferase with HDIG domain